MLWFNVGCYGGRRGGSSSCCGLVLDVAETGRDMVEYVVCCSGLYNTT